MDIIDRREHIRKIVESKISDIGADNVYRKDARYHSQIYQFIEIMTEVGKALEDRGVNQEIRKQVLDDCFFTGSSDQELAARRLVKAEKTRIKLTSDWDKEE